MTVVEFRKPTATQNQRSSYNREARRLAASKPRNSKNGTPEERAAKAGPVVDRVRIPRRSKNGTPEERAAKKASAPIVEIAPQRADRIVASVVKLVGKGEGAAQSGPPRDTLAARRKAMLALVEFAEREEQSDGPSAA
jgi:hypothetical protein